ncbi:MAG TPA: hypothetical protein VGN64_19380 [Dyadobacter sp.]|jgi:flagellar biosynthesis/type III secretory pathway protein FliH|nr:hypothetical protein [Dyadobacter sp.]
MMSTLDIFVEKGRKLGLEEGMEKGLEKGIEKGLEEGLEKGKIEFVTNLLKNTDFDLSKIALLTNVSKAFVKNIQSNLH